MKASDWVSKSASLGLSNASSLNFGASEPGVLIVLLLRGTRDMQFLTHVCKSQRSGPKVPKRRTSLVSGTELIRGAYEKLFPPERSQIFETNVNFDLG